MSQLEQQFNKNQVKITNIDKSKKPLEINLMECLP